MRPRRQPSRLERDLLERDAPHDVVLARNARGRQLVDAALAGEPLPTVLAAPIGVPDGELRACLGCFAPVPAGATHLCPAQETP